MKPHGSFARLVRARLFQLIDAAGRVVGIWETGSDPFGAGGQALKYRYLPVAGLVDEENAGLVFSESTGIKYRAIWLLGPRNYTTSQRRSYLGLVENDPDLFAMRVGAGNPTSEIGFAPHDTAGLEAIRDNTAAPFTCVARVGAGGVVLELYEDGVTGYANLRRGATADARAIASVWQETWNPTVANVTIGGAGAVTRYRCTVNGIPGGPRHVLYEFRITIGAGGGVTGDIQLTPHADHPFPEAVTGIGWFQDVSTSVRHAAHILSAAGGGGAMVIRPLRYNGAAAGLAYVDHGLCAAAIPFAWAAGDHIVGSVGFSLP